MTVTVNGVTYVPEVFSSTSVTWPAAASGWELEKAETRRTIAMLQEHIKLLDQRPSQDALLSAQTIEELRTQLAHRESSLTRANAVIRAKDRKISEFRDLVAQQAGVLYDVLDVNEGE